MSLQTRRVWVHPIGANSGYWEYITEDVPDASPRPQLPAPQPQVIRMDAPRPQRHNGAQEAANAAIGVAVAGVLAVAAVAVLGVAAHGFVALPRALKVIVFLGLLAFGIGVYHDAQTHQGLFAPPAETMVGVDPTPAPTPEVRRAELVRMPHHR